MTYLLNISIWVLFFLWSCLIIYTVYLLRKKRKKTIIRSLTILFLITVLLSIFYYPTNLKLDFSKKYEVTIIENGEMHNITENKQIDNILKLVNEQIVIKSTTKTLLGTNSVPSNDNISIFISGNNISFSLLIFIRKNATSDSYIEKNGQYYKILDTENIIKSVEEFINF